MGQNNVAELSGACIKSSRACYYNDAVDNQQNDCALCYVSNFARSLKRVSALLGTRKSIGLAMAQMPARPSSSLSTTLIPTGEQKKE